MTEVEHGQAMGCLFRVSRKFTHDDVIKLKHFLSYWPFVRGIHWSPVNSPHKGQWCRTSMFSLICPSTNGWVNNRDVSDFRCNWAHYDVTIMHVITGPYCIAQHDDRMTLFGMEIHGLWGIPLTKGQKCRALMLSVLVNLIKVLNK